MQQEPTPPSFPRQESEAEPGHPRARLLEATALLVSGRTQDGVARLQDLAASLEGSAQDDFLAGVLKNLAIARLTLGEEDEALRLLQRVAELQPTDFEARKALATLLQRRGRGAESLVYARAVAAVAPTSPDALRSLARSQEETGHFGEAVAALERAVAVQPSEVDALRDLGRLLAEAGDIRRLAAILPRLRSADPEDPALQSASLALLHYDPDVTAEGLRLAGQDWGRTLRARVGPVESPRVRSLPPGAPLRVGYLGPDFRGHSCADFLEPLYRAHDRAAVEVVTLMTAATADTRTETFRGLSSEWHDVSDLGEDALASRLRSLGLEVIVDLAGHTAGGRIAALAQRPAPVLLSWLGYPADTGLDVLDGRISDSRVDPTGAATLDPVLRLDPCYLCWQPPVSAPPLRQTSRSRPFTFASFNHFAKINERVIQVWAAILRRCGGSRLLLKGRGAALPSLREGILEGFQEAGVPARRIEFADWKSESGSHLALYDEVDLALDPFPWNGVTTTLEALWMGIPVLALEGSSSLGRQSSSFLRLLGLDLLVARDLSDYIERGSVFHREREGMADSAKELRARLLGSPLCDPAGFAGRMEALYRDQLQQAAVR